jgi:capsular polysaccharide biosynthesis protein
MAANNTSAAGLADVLRRGWWVVLLVALPVVGGATLYVERLPAEYEATAIVAVVPKPATPDPDLVRIAAPRYVALVTAPATLQELAGEIGQDPADLRGRVSAAVATDTGNVTITVRDQSPRVATTAANLLAAKVDEASAADRLTSVELIAPAVQGRQPAGPPRRLIEASALLVGLVLGIALAAGLARTRRPTPRPGLGPRSRTLDGIPIVGEVPVTSAPVSAGSVPPRDAATLEAGETLRNAVAGWLGGRVRGRLVVTSPHGWHGRTAVAGALAAALARGGDQVLLVGIGWEGPAGEPGQPTDDGRLGWRSELRVLEERLWFLPVWADEKPPGDAGTQLATVLEEAHDLFDAVVVDGPPAAKEVVRTLTRSADGLLVVVAEADASAAPQRSLRTLVATLGARSAGVVVHRSGRTADRHPAELPPPSSR